ncbi:hypothetical protein WMY93_010296 [Mugilogobius chulae]|uniref:Endonuclease domain-containing 1 protein n=1 Tax=Mugilogobius chulae TaxID=88201 RepID=A0AAW0P6S1_9GOBI
MRKRLEACGNKQRRKPSPEAKQRPPGPLFSAYILKAANGKRPNSTWMYEPQLCFSRADPEMQPLPYPMVDNNIIESQAVLDDYKNSNYTKGHLNPSMHQETQINRMATFTLTNIVPQRAGSNSGSWNELEQEVLRLFKKVCVGSMYVITGALPHINTHKWVNNRVLIPEYMWSAYCCPVYNNSLSNRGHFPTYAAVGRNDRHSDQEIVPINPQKKSSKQGYDVRRMSLEALEEVLSQKLGTTISLFQDQCQPNAALQQPHDYSNGSPMVKCSPLSSVIWPIMVNWAMGWTIL